MHREKRRGAGTGTAALPLEAAVKQRSRVHVRYGEEEDRRLLAVPLGRRGAGTSTAALPLEAAVTQRPLFHVRNGEEEGHHRLVVPAERRGAGTSTAALPLGGRSKAEAPSSH